LRLLYFRYFFKGKEIKSPPLNKKTPQRRTSGSGMFFLVYLVVICPSRRSARWSKRRRRRRCIGRRGHSRCPLRSHHVSRASGP